MGKGLLQWVVQLPSFNFESFNLKNNKFRFLYSLHFIWLKLKHFWLCCFEWYLHRFSCWYLCVVSCISVAFSFTRKKDCAGQVDAGAEVEHCVPAEDITTTDNRGIARKCMSHHFHPCFRFSVLLFWNCLSRSDQVFDALFSFCYTLVYISLGFYHFFTIESNIKLFKILLSFFWIRPENQALHAVVFNFVLCTSCELLPYCYRLLLISFSFSYLLCLFLMCRLLFSCICLVQ